MEKLIKKVSEDILKEAEEAAFGDVCVARYDTNYFIPTIYGLTGKRVGCIEDLREVLEVIREGGVEKKILVGCSILEAVRHKGGFVSDTMIRKLGLPLVQGEIPGVVVVAGEGEHVSKVVKDLLSKGMLVFRLGSKLEGLEKVIYIGERYYDVSLIFDVIFRIPMIFAKIEEEEKLVDYVRKKLPGFVLAFGDLDEKLVGIAGACIWLNIPVLTEKEVPKIEGLLEQVEIDKMVERGCEIKGIKTSSLCLDLPVDVGKMYTGQTIKKEDLYAEFGNKEIGFEVLIKKEGVEDKIEVIGDLKQGPNPLGIVVKVDGDFDPEVTPVFERKIHEYLNCIDGFMHLASRDIIWCRVSKDCVDKGFKLRHIGEVISGYLKEDFEMIKKVEVEIIVDQEKVEEEIEKAREIYKERDSRVLSLTEEDVDEFYGCTLCQSFAPDHVCIITPERGSLCGATTWFDAKMAVKLGQKQNFVVEKGEKIGEGEYTGVNKEFERKSHGKIKHVRLHTVFGNPPTSCGCFEAIVFYIPEVDGFGIVHRDFKGKCVNGLKFSTMAGQTGGGVQTEGFLGIGISYISSKKFLISDGGLDRVVWMPKDLKARLEGIDFGKIADEDVDTIDKLQDFLREKNPMILEKMGKWNDHCN